MTPWLIALSLLVWAISGSGRKHRHLALCFAAIYAAAMLAFPAIKPSGVWYYVCCAAGELLVIASCVAFRNGRNPAPIVVGLISTIAIAACWAAAVDWQSGGGPAYARYKMLILTTQASQLAAIALFSPKAVAAMLFVAGWVSALNKRLIESKRRKEASRWPAKQATR